MRAVVQRVVEGNVSVDGDIKGEIKTGLVVLLGVEKGDTEKDAFYMADKVVNLRIFEDEQGKMNLSLKDVGGDLLVISQFTLLGDARKGKRPSFIDAARPETANILYNKFAEYTDDMGIKTEKGVFQAEMLVKIYNDGPVTILIDSKKNF